MFGIIHCRFVALRNSSISLLQPPSPPLHSVHHYMSITANVFELLLVRSKTDYWEESGYNGANKITNTKTLLLVVVGHDNQFETTFSSTPELGSDAPQRDDLMTKTTLDQSGRDKQESTELWKGRGERVS